MREGGLTTDASLRPRVSVLLGPGATFQGTADGAARALRGGGERRGVRRSDTGRAGAGDRGLQPASPPRRDVGRAPRRTAPAAAGRDRRRQRRLDRQRRQRPHVGRLVRRRLARAAHARAGRARRSPTRSSSCRRRRRPCSPPTPTRRRSGRSSPPACSAIRSRTCSSSSRRCAGSARARRRRRSRCWRTWSATRRRCWPPRAPAARCCAASTPCSRVRRPTVDPARVARARALLDAALFAGAPGQRARVPFSELPETPAQLASRGPLGAAGADRDPPGGYHRLVLGRDVGVGRIATETILGVDYRGPAYAGRLPPAPFVAADAALLPTDAQSTARLEIVVGIAANEGNLDAIRLRDAGVISSGIHQWSAHQPEELPSLLFRFKSAGRRRVGPLLRRVRARRPARSRPRPCRAVRAPERRGGRDPRADGVRRDPGFLRRHGRRRRDGVVRHRLGGALPACGARLGGLPALPDPRGDRPLRPHQATGRQHRGRGTLPSRSSSSSPPSRASR